MTDREFSIEMLKAIRNHPNYQGMTNKKFYHDLATDFEIVSWRTVQAWMRPFGKDDFRYPGKVAREMIAKKYRKLNLDKE